MRVLEALGHRWALRILWELRADALTFRGLRDATGGVSPSVLNDRLRELRQLDIVDLSEDGYSLTVAGRKLVPILLALHRWAQDHVEGADAGQARSR